MKHFASVPSLLVSLAFVFTAQAQWIKIPLPGTPRTKDGKPNLTAPAPRAPDGHLELGGIWVVNRDSYSATCAELAICTSPRDAWCYLLLQEIVGRHYANVVRQFVGKTDRTAGADVQRIRQHRGVPLLIFG
jgi:hypothetical protein